MSSTPGQQRHFAAADFAADNKFHLLLSASGSVATIKIPTIITALSSHPNLSIRLILTRSATEFLRGQSAEQPSLAEIRCLPNVDGIYLDEDEWAVPWTRGAPILHIELRRWADLLVVAPLSANTLAKLVCGLCDNLLLSTIRAWDVTGFLSSPREIRKLGGTLWRKDVRKIMVAPAMNTAMWHHPVTKRHIDVLETGWGVDSENGGWVQVLRPIEKDLACGDTGSGAMRSWQDIVSEIERYFELEKLKENGP